MQRARSLIIGRKMFNGIHRDSSAGAAKDVGAEMSEVVVGPHRRRTNRFRAKVPQTVSNASERTRTSWTTAGLNGPA